MYCNPESKIVFIHIPRNGGLTLGGQLAKLHNYKVNSKRNANHTVWNSNGEHRDIGLHTKLSSVRILAREIGVDVESFFKFCIVRNPYTKTQSVWRWCNQHKRTAERKGWTRIEDMLEYIEKNPGEKVHWQPQSEWTHPMGEEESFTKIYRNEQYEEMLKDLNARGFAVAVREGSNGTHKGNNDQLNEFSRRWIEKLYAKDFELLEY